MNNTIDFERAKIKLAEDIQHVNNEIFEDVEEVIAFALIKMVKDGWKYEWEDIKQ